MPSFLIRFAESEADRHAIFRFRYDLYVTQQGLFQEEADHERKWLTDDGDSKGHLVMAELSGKLLGTARLTWGADAPFSEEYRELYNLDAFNGVLADRDIMIGTRLLVDPEFRGGLLLFQMLWFCFEFSARNSVEVYLGNCEPHLVAAYHKIGFRPFGALSNHPTNGMLVPVACLAGDFEYHRQIKSTMLPALLNRPTPPRYLPELRRILADHVPVVGEVDRSEHFWDEVNTLLNDPEHGLCGGLFEREEALVLLAKSQLIRCPAEMAVIRKDHVSQTVYILLDGSLRVLDGEREVAEVTRRGALVGEVAFFAQRTRMSDVVVGADGATLLALNHSTLKRLIKGYGTQAAKFLLYVTRELSEKLLERAARS